MMKKDEYDYWNEHKDMTSLIGRFKHLFCHIEGISFLFLHSMMIFSLVLFAGFMRFSHFISLVMFGLGLYHGICIILIKCLIKLEMGQYELYQKMIDLEIGLEDTVLAVLCNRSEQKSKGDAL